MSKEKNPQASKGSIRKDRTKEDFDSRLRRARRDTATPENSGSAALPDEAKGAAIRIGTELVVAVAVGGGIGYLIDGWLGTKPWFLIGFLLLGNAAGLWNVFRLSNNQGYAAGFGSDKRNQTDDTNEDNSKDE